MFVRRDRWRLPVLAGLVVAACTEPLPPAKPRDPWVIAYERHWAEATPLGLRKLDKLTKPPAHLACDELPDPASVDRLCVRRTGRWRIGADPVEVCDGVHFEAYSLSPVLAREVLKHVVRAGVCRGCDIDAYEGDVVVSSLEVCMERWDQASPPEHRVPFLGRVDHRFPTEVTLAPDAPVTYQVRVSGRRLLELRTFVPPP